MSPLLFVLYVVVEVAAVVAVGNAIGAVWTVCLLIAGSALGLVLVGSQGRRVMEGLRGAALGLRSPEGAIADGVLVAVGAMLMFVPGLVTSVLGLLLLIPPTRSVLRPAVVYLATRRFGKLPTGPVVVEGEVVSQWTEPQVRPRAIAPVTIDADTGWHTDPM